MPSIGGRGNNGKAHLDTWFDVYEWGGRPGIDNLGTVDTALENIRNYILFVRDAGVSGARNSPAIIYFRDSADFWYLLRPFFVERPFWEIRGGGREQTRVVGQTQAPCFIFGLPRGIQDSSYPGYDGTNPLYLSAGHWVDSYGILDTHAAPAAGSRYALRLNHDSFISCPKSPFSDGISDGWAKTRQLTIEFCIDPGTGQKLGANELFGCGDARPMPFYVQSLSSNEIRFSFAVTGENQPALQFAQFSLGDATGLVKGTIQIDLANATVQAWLGTTQLAVSLSDASTFLAGNNMSFARNDYAPFNIGKRDLAVVFQESSTTVDHTYHGLQISNRLVYSDSMGNAQARIDGTAITDLNRYFDTTHCVACLPLTDPPRGNSGCHNDGRLVTILGSGTATTHGLPANTVGHFLSFTNNITPVLGLSQRISDITVSNGGCLTSGAYGTPEGGFLLAFGQAIAIGAVWEMYIDNVTASSFGQGIGALNAGAGWTHYLSDVSTEGGDAGYANYWNGFDIQRMKLTAQGRAGVRYVASTGRTRFLFFGDAPAGTDAAVSIIGGQFGGIYELEDLTFDNEFGGGPQSAVIVCEAAFNAPSSLRIRNFFSAKVLDDGVLVWLKDANPGGGDFTNPDVGHGPSTFTLDGVGSYGFNHVANIRIDSTLWNGTVENVQVGYGGYRYLEAVPMFDSSGANGVGRIVYKSRDYVMPPREGVYQAGCFNLDVQVPRNGHPTGFRCARDGVMNTDTPPLWFGIDPVDDGSGNVAAYVVDNTYVSAVALTG